MRCFVLAAVRRSPMAVHNLLQKKALTRDRADCWREHLHAYLQRPECFLPTWEDQQITTSAMSTCIYIFLWHIALWCKPWSVGGVFSYPMPRKYSSRGSDHYIVIMFLPTWRKSEQLDTEALYLRRKCFWHAVLDCLSRHSVVSWHPTGSVMVIERTSQRDSACRHDLGRSTVIEAILPVVSLWLLAQTAYA